MKSLQNEYNLIKEGKGNKELFIKEARTLFPNIVTNVLTFDQAIHNLNERGIISEGFTGELSQRAGEPNWFKIFSENTEGVKATLKDTDKAVVEKETAGYDYEDKKNNNNISTEEILNGYYAEMKDPKNADKTEQELKNTVFKNLEKDPLFYIKNAAFGVKGIGYTEDHPGLGPTKEVTGKYKSSGMEPVKLNEGINDLTAFHKGSHSTGRPDFNKMTADQIEAYLEKDKDKAGGLFGRSLSTVHYILKKKREEEKLKENYGSSDGDYEADQEAEQMSDYYYDKGLEAYSEGDYMKAENFRRTALRYGSYVGRNDTELPPYDKNHSLEEASNSTANELASYIGVLQKEINAEDNPKKLKMLKQDLEDTKKELAKKSKKDMNEYTGGRIEVPRNYGMDFDEEDYEDYEDDEDQDYYDEEGNIIPLRSPLHPNNRTMEETNNNMTGNKEALSEAKKRAIDKHLAEIDKLGEVAALEYKMGKVQEKIEELKNRLTMTESDDMKDMVDKKAISEIKKDIAYLEKTKKMYEAKKAKAVKKVSGHTAKSHTTGREEVLDEAQAPIWEEAMKSVLKKRGY
jgi:cob(I)alamin adenosyltransferase